MRKLCIIIAVAGMACAALAEPNPETSTITLGTSTGGTGTVANAKGYLHEVYVGVSDGVSTGNVAITYQPAISTIAAVNVATNSVTDEKVFRPRQDGTTVAGAANTSDPPERFFFVEETITFVVTGSPTGLVWTAYFKMDKDKTR